MKMPDTLRWHDGVLILLDQTRLPLNESYIDCRDYRRVAEAIKRLKCGALPPSARRRPSDWFWALMNWCGPVSRCGLSFRKLPPS